MNEYFDIENKLIDNIFTDAEIHRIYQNNELIPDDYKRRVEEVGYHASHDPLNDELTEKIKNILENVSGKSLEKYMVHFARYTKDENSSPMLMPHFDVGLEYATVSICIVLESTLDWDIAVEGKTFKVSKNQGVTFSGSHQWHWRPNIEFSDNDYYDILVCQYKEKGNLNPITEEHKDIMRKRTVELVENWQFENPSGPYSDKQWLLDNYVNGDMDISDICTEYNQPTSVILRFLDLYEITVKQP